MYRYSLILLLSVALCSTLISAQEKVDTNCVWWVSSNSTDDSQCTITNPCSKLNTAINLANNLTACNLTTTRYIYVIPDGEYSGEGNTQISIDRLQTRVVITIIVSSANLPSNTSNVVYPLPPADINPVFDAKSENYLFRFYHNQANYTFVGLTFKNANANILGYPIFISDAPSVNFKSCVFQNNTGIKGGCIYLKPFSSSFISDSQFIDNYSEDNGGAIISSQSHNLTNVIFRNNRAKNSGGAIYLNSGTLNVHGCEFTNNTANDGGAVYVIASTSSILSGLGWRYISFVNNTAINGAAIYDKLSTMRYYYLNMTGNVATGKGGAAYFEDSQSGLFSSMISRNSASKGGAVFTVDTVPKSNQLLITDTNFTSNAADFGGALYCNTSTARMNVRNKFSSNTAKQDKETNSELCTETCLTSSSNKECGCMEGCGLPPPPVQVITDTTETKIAVAIFVPVTAVLIGIVGYLIWKTNKNKAKMQQRAFDEIRLTPNSPDNEQL